VYPVVLVAHRLKLFAFLADRPRSLDEVCDKLGLKPRPAETMLAVCASTGFLERRDGRFALTPVAEDYLLEELAPSRTRFTYRVAVEPRLALGMVGPIARTLINSILRNACKGLQGYVLKAGTSRRVGDGASKAGVPGPASAPYPSAERKHEAR